MLNNKTLHLKVSHGLKLNQNILYYCFGNIFNVHICVDILTSKIRNRKEFRNLKILHCQVVITT